MIYFIGKSPDAVPVSSFAAFMDWAYDQPDYQFDVETNVTDDEVKLKKVIWCTKKLITVQFGDTQGKDQWVLQWSYLNPAQKLLIKAILEGEKIKLIHNAAFECVVCLFHGIRIQNVYDTMLMEMILNCGLLNYANDEDDEMENPEEASFYSLSGLCARYLCYYLEKSDWQMSFGDDVLPGGKIIYAANDVKPLGAIRRMQIPEIQQNDLDYVAALENEAVLGFSMMTYNGMELNVDKWRDNIALAVPVVEQARVDLAKAVIEDDVLRETAISNNWYDLNDRWTINWNSIDQKYKVLMHCFPALPGATKAVLTKWLKQKIGNEDEMAVVKRIIEEGKFDYAEKYAEYYYRDWLIENEFLVPGGELTINWNSPDQKLKLLQAIHPKLTSTDKRSLEKVNHVVKEYMIKYGQAKKLISTYGEKFLLHIEPDGKVRTTFKQIVSTGRVGSSPKLYWAA